jgi:transposase
VLLPRQQAILARGAKDKEHAVSKILNAAIAIVGIDIGKNAFHVVGQGERGAIVLHQKWSRGQVAARFANMPPCLIGMEACVGVHHLSRKLNGPLATFARPAPHRPRGYDRTPPSSFLISSLIVL